jgi:hypothetical protein
MWSIVEPTCQILYPPNCLVRQASLWSWGCFQGPHTGWGLVGFATAEQADGQTPIRSV